MSTGRAPTAREIIDIVNLGCVFQMLVLATELKKNKHSLQHSVSAALRQYLEDLDGEAPENLYETVIGEIEKPLLEIVMQHCDNNQSRAASCLGINRGTLRKKLQHYRIKH